MTIKDLENYGINLDEAMELCIGDEDIYKEVLETFMEEGREKLVLMEDLMNAKDVERYIIEAHGLKNAAKQIGADELSAMSKDSEFDGKEGRPDSMFERHSLLMEKYRSIVDVISQLF